LVRGDLDWIVMKALEKDRTRRFETANELAMDIQRHLANEPVLASPPSSLYRFQKLVHRNKAAFAALGGIVGALIIGLGLSLYMFARERQARERAVAAERQQNRMRREAEIKAQVGQKLMNAGLLMSHGQFDEASQLVSDMTDPAAASIFNVLGNVYARMGRLPQAATHLTRATELLPQEHDTYHYLAPLLVQTGDYRAYGRLRSVILKQFGETSDPAIAERMAKDCLLLPPAPEDAAKIDKMVGTALNAGPQHQFWPYFQFVKGLAELR